jgi:hypothetical protein
MATPKYKDPKTQKWVELIDIQALKKEILQGDNPVGTIRMQTVNTNPKTYLGFGEWVLWGSGRVPVGVNTQYQEFNEVEKMGGEMTHVLSVSEMPKHRHDMWYRDDAGTRQHDVLVYDGFLNNRRISDAMDDSGDNQPHNNLQPYITCYMFKRIS